MALQLNLFVDSPRRQEILLFILEKFRENDKYSKNVIFYTKATSEIFLCLCKSIDDFVGFIYIILIISPVVASWARFFLRRTTTAIPWNMVFLHEDAFVSGSTGIMKIKMIIIITAYLWWSLSIFIVCGVWALQQTAPGWRMVNFLYTPQSWLVYGLTISVAGFFFFFCGLLLSFSTLVSFDLSFLGPFGNIGSRWIWSQLWQVNFNHFNFFQSNYH